MRKKLSFLSLFIVFLILILASCGKKKTVEVVQTPNADTTTYFYTGSEIKYQIPESNLYSISNNIKTNAGSYEVIVRLNDKDNYKWSNDQTTDLTYSFVIYPKKIDKPVVTEKIYSYTGEEITFEIPSSDYYQVKDNKKIEAGSYQATVSLKDKTNYVWADNTTDDIKYNFSIINNDVRFANISDLENSYTYRGEAITPTPLVKLGEDILTLNDDYTLSYTNNLNAGEATITITGIGSYKGTLSKTFTILKANPVVTAPVAKANLAYNGNSQDLITAGSTTAGTMLYKLNDNEYSDSIPQATNAGTYTVYYKVEGNDNYNDVSEKSLEVTIAKEASTIVTAPTAIENLVYTGKALNLITAGEALNGTLHYSFDDDSYFIDIPQATNAGTYTIYYKVLGNENYADSDTFTIEVTISKADATITIPTLKDELIYTGSALELINEATTTGGTIKYSIGNINYSASIPTGINAGTYTVYYKLEGGENYKDIEAATIDATISKATPSLIDPTAKILTFNNTNQDLINLGEASLGTLVYSLDDVDYKTISPKGCDAGTYKVYYKVIGDENVNDIEATFIEVTISKATPTVTAPKGFDNLTWTGSELVLIEAGSTTGGTLVYSLDDTNYSDDLPKAKDEGQYTIYYKVEGNNNYNDVDAKTITSTIVKDKEVPVVTIEAQSKLIYNGTAQDLLSKASTNGGTLNFKLENGTYSETTPSATDAGTYKVYYKVVGDDKYTDVAEQFIEVTIAKATPTITSLPTAISNLVYTGDSQKLIKEGTVTGGSFKYRIGASGNPDANIPEATNAKTYQVYFMVVGDSNYNNIDFTDEHIIEVTIEKADSSITTIPTGKKDLVFNGNAQELVNAGEAEGGSLQYSLNNNDYSTTIPTGTNAGNYTVYFKVVGDANHKDIAYATIDVTIAKATSTLTTSPVKIDNLVYTGETQNLITAGKVSIGELLYSLDDNAYSTTIPAAINNGTYTVYFKVLTTDNIDGIDTQSLNVSISKKSITDAIVTLDSTDYAYTGTTIKPSVVSVISNNRTLVVNVDFEIVYDENAVDYNNTYNVTINGINNYEGSIDVPFNIILIKKDISASSVTLSTSSFTYNGQSQKPTITVTYNETELEETKDYTVDFKNSNDTYGNTTDADTITIIITGTGLYEGTTSKTYVIEKKTLTNPVITIKEETYTGNAISPTLISVIDPDGNLNITSLCNISSNTSTSKVNAGTYPITIIFNTNNKNYNDGQFAASFTIKPKSSQGLVISDIDDIPFTDEIELNGAFPSISITDGGYIVDNENYELVYTNNNLITNSALITITFKNNYTGELTKTFKIVESTFTITYIDGDYNSTQNYHSTDTTVAIISRTKNGYNGKWVSSTDSTKEFEFGKNTTPDVLGGTITLVAQWTIIEYKVEYELNGGTNNSNNIKKYTVETALFTLLNPEGRPYVAIFDGWYDNKEFNGEKITTIAGGQTENITLYAKWNYISYTITYILDGGINNPNNTSALTNIEELDLEAPTKQYYDFKGWYTDSNYSNPISTISNLVSNIEIFAKWELHNYTITYIFKDESNNNLSSVSHSNPATYTFKENEEITLTDPRLNRYGFIGWYNNSSMTLGDEINSISRNTPDNITLYAKFHSTNTNFEMYLNDSLTHLTTQGTITSNLNQKVVGETVTVTANVNPNYTFDGWYNGNNLVTHNSSFTFNLTTDTITYKAKYYVYTITYSSSNTERGTVTGDISSGSPLSAGDTVTLDATTQVEGGVFLGWYNNDTNDKLSSSLSYTYTMTSSSINIVAKWSLVQVLPNDTALGSVSGINSDYLLGDTINLSATAYTDFIFAGWYTNTETKDIISTDNPYEITTTESDVIYYALFKEYTPKYANYLISSNPLETTPQTYERVYTTLDTTLDITPTITITDTTVTYTMVKNDDYIFAGWWSSNTDSRTLKTYSYSYEMSIDDSSTLYALWINPYDILSLTYNNEAGNAAITDFDLIQNGITVLATDLDSNNYDWDGWYNNSSKLSSNKEYTVPFVGTALEALASTTALTAEPKLNLTANWNAKDIVVIYNEDQGTITKEFANEKYTITATPALGYHFDKWTDTSNNTISTENVLTDITIGSGPFKAVFAPDNNIVYTINYYFEDYASGDYTIASDFTMIKSDGVTDANKEIDRTSLKEGKTIPTGYEIDYAKANNETINPTVADGTIYNLMIFANGSSQIDFYFKLSTVAITYHYNSSKGIENHDSKYKPENGYPLLVESNITWYTDCDLTEANAVTYVSSSCAVYACYKGNNNLAQKFTFTTTDDSTWTANYKEEISSTSVIVFPDYYQDKPITTVNVDNLVGATYASLHLPENLQFFEYGSYNDTQITWIKLSNTNGTFKLLSKENLINAIKFDDDGIFTSYEDSSINDYLKSLSSSLKIGALDLLTSEEFNLFSNIISKQDNWWLKTVINDSGIVFNFNYVNNDNSIEMSTYLTIDPSAVMPEFAIRPTVTITLTNLV